MENLIVSLGPTLAPLATFAAILLAGIGLYLLTGYRQDQVRRRLQDIPGQAAAAGAPNWKSHDNEFLVRWLEPAGELILPKDEWQRSQLRRQLVHAGFRDSKALYVFLGAKIFFGLALPLAIAAGLLLTGNRLFIFSNWGIVTLLLAAGVGWIIPDRLLAFKINNRRLEFIEGFPDALDMLVVCVEAGLGLDAGINRVSKELGHSHPRLATELSLLSLEVRAGKSRQEAFRSLADRMNIDQVHALSTILIQAERYGTSIATALRNFAEEMRIERIQRAREIAAKLPVKMIFPIMAFIFPALFLVLLGPAMVRISAAFA